MNEQLSEIKDLEDYIAKYKYYIASSEDWPEVKALAELSDKLSITNMPCGNFKITQK